MKDQTAKADAGKAPLSLVPRRIIFDIARIREYGNKKYGDPDNWKNVEVERYRDAAFRHLLAYLDDPYGVDEESGLPHYWHLACNVAFICEMEDGKICSPGFCPEVKMRDIKRKEKHKEFVNAMRDIKRKEKYKEFVNANGKRLYCAPYTIAFEKKKDAEKAVNELLNIASDYGYVRALDFCDICALPDTPETSDDRAYLDKHGWNYETIKRVQPTKENGIWVICVPEPVEIPL